MTFIGPVRRIIKTIFNRLVRTVLFSLIKKILIFLAKIFVFGTDRKSNRAARAHNVF